MRKDSSQQQLGDALDLLERLQAHMWKFGGDLLVTAFGPASRISRRVVEGEREEAPVSWIRREVQKLVALAGIDDDETNEITYRRYTGESSRAAALLTVVESELWAAGGGVTRHRVGLTDAGRTTMARWLAERVDLTERCEALVSDKPDKRRARLDLNRWQTVRRLLSDA